MAFTELNAVSATTASAERAIAAGASERVGLKAAGPVDSSMAAMIQIKDDAAGWQNYRELQGGINPSEVLQGPLTYRTQVRRGACGAYVES